MIYFLRASNGGPVKIGFTNNLKRRMIAYRTHNPEEVIVIRTIDGDRLTEKWLHKEFSELRIRTEWFTFTESMLTIDIPEDIPKESLKIIPPCIRELDQPKYRQRRSARSLDEVIFYTINGVSAHCTIFDDDDSWKNDPNAFRGHDGLSAHEWERLGHRPFYEKTRKQRVGIKGGIASGRARRNRLQGKSIY